MKHYLMWMQALAQPCAKFFGILLLSAKTFPQHNDEQCGPYFPILAIELPEVGGPQCSTRYGVTNMASQLCFNANLVRLQEAVLCANCEMISEGSNGHCACCGSQSLLSLSKVLGVTINSEFSFSVAPICVIFPDDKRVSSLAEAA